jgi:hypothetical protein
VRGYFNYYLTFAGNFHAVINRILLSPANSRYSDIINWLIKQHHISFRPPDTQPPIEMATDASLAGLGATTMNRTPPVTAQKVYAGTMSPVNSTRVVYATVDQVHTLQGLNSNDSACR